MERIGYKIEVVYKDKSIRHFIIESMSEIEKYRKSKKVDTVDIIDKNFVISK